jgi:hypothetical protein
MQTTLHSMYYSRARPRKFPLRSRGDDISTHLACLPFRDHLN